MNRLLTMARFAEPTEEKIIAHCEECEAELYCGDSAVQTIDGYFCSDKCLVSFIGATGVIL